MKHILLPFFVIMRHIWLIFVLWWSSKKTSYRSQLLLIQKCQQHNTAIMCSNSAKCLHTIYRTQSRLWFRACWNLIDISNQQSGFVPLYLLETDWEEITFWSRNRIIRNIYLCNMWRDFGGKLFSSLYTSVPKMKFYNLVVSLSPGPLTVMN